MNIVYGVSGEGLGHVFEAIEIAEMLRRDGHVVKVLTYGERACRALARFTPTPIEGVHLCFGPTGLSLGRTLRRNLGIFPFYLRHGRRLWRELRAFRPDVFLTAYEPFTMIAAHGLRKPLISMDNQNELRHLTRPPGASGAAFYLARATTAAVTYGAEDYIVKSFHRAVPHAPRVHVVAPIIQREIRALAVSHDGPVLVYLTKENPALTTVLRSMERPFVVYCHGRVGTDGNLTYRAPGPAFLADLASCEAIIGTTGFSLIADAIYLKKPYFGVPLKKQFEQTHNAHFLRDSGLGAFAEDVTRETLAEFFTALPRYRERLIAYDLDPAQQEETLRGLLARRAGASADHRPATTAICPRT